MVSNMTHRTGNTPTVTFKLDYSEKLRLERLRNRLKLSGWEKIQERYTLVGDEKIAEKIENLKTTNNIEHEQKYAVWSNRFTDFEMEWKQIKNPATNTVEGQLRAVGCMRVENLGLISAGCYAVIMSGPLNASPLPSTKVTALRVHHLSLSIRFMTPQRFDNPYIQGHNQSIRFKLGKHNKMFGYKGCGNPISSQKQVAAQLRD